MHGADLPDAATVWEESTAGAVRTGSRGTSPRALQTMVLATGNSDGGPC
ncbi:MAG TPA: hypothetical protein VG054_00725 [Acidimicrobiales bacterium]|nr:hypothetical protein [Acidimicrobiales bacterium]